MANSEPSAQVRIDSCNWPMPAIELSRGECCEQTIE